MPHSPSEPLVAQTVSAAERTRPALLAFSVRAPPLLSVTVATPAAFVTAAASPPATVAPATGEDTPVGLNSTTVALNGAPGATVDGTLRPSGRTGGFWQAKSGAGPTSQRATRNRTSSPSCSSAWQTPTACDLWLIHSSKKFGSGNACVSPRIRSTE